MSESITCPICKLTSHHLEDVRTGYCGNCHWWTSSLLPQLFESVLRGADLRAVLQAAASVLVNAVDVVPERDADYWVLDCIAWRYVTIGEVERIIVLEPLLWGKWRLCVGGPNPGDCYDDIFEYADPVDVAFAYLTWSGDGDAPDGWHRNPTTGRRRPNGDKTKEEVRP